MEPNKYIEAARIPESLPSCEFGLWEIYRQEIFPKICGEVDIMTVLAHMTMETMHRVHGETVMEDTRRELRRHLPIWMQAYGHVLLTGLGLGCVVRGLLINPTVEQIDVVEIDPQIIKVVGPEFESDKRVRIHKGNALSFKWPDDKEWDFAWHDLWMEEDGLQRVHGKLMIQLFNRARRQGAWAFPRECKKGFNTIG